MSIPPRMLPHSLPAATGAGLVPMVCHDKLPAVLAPFLRRAAQAGGSLVRGDPSLAVAEAAPQHP